MTAPELFARCPARTEYWCREARDLGYREPCACMLDANHEGRHRCCCGTRWDPVRARTTDPPTSHAAAASMESGGAAGHRRAILDALRAWGEMNYSQLDQFLGWPNATANRRLAELRRAGHVRKTGDTTPTPSGREAAVYDITPAGRAWLTDPRATPPTAPPAAGGRP